MNSPTPRPVKNVGASAHFCQVECGTFHTVALTKLGDVYTWGFNGNGRLGLADGAALDTRQRLAPVLIKRIEGQAAKDDSDVGLPMDESQAATTALVKALRPKQVSRLVLGGFHSAALSDHGDVYTWGDGRHSATGIDLSREEDKEVRAPTRVLGLGGARNTVSALAAGVKHMLAVTSEGKLFSWGDGACGQLGHGDQSSVMEPRLVSTLKSRRMHTVAAGEEHSIGASRDGETFSWGSRPQHRIGRVVALPRCACYAMLR
jgi:alpha-tubulin suppressor-like RCC1 family protein